MTRLSPRQFAKLGARRAQWLTVLCVVALSLIAPRARAAAPICDPSGASMVAPVPVLPNATGDLVAPKSCDDATHGVLDLAKPHRGDAPVLRVTEVPDRVAAAAPVWPKARGTKIPRPDRASPPDLPAHGASVYRPPRG